MKVVIIDLDGLRRDVFLEQVSSGEVPVFSEIFGEATPLNCGSAVHLPAVTNALSVTFPCQATIFTGAEPSQHGLEANQFFDRFGTRTGGKPRHYAFDVGDAMAFDDAVRVFSGPVGLANEILSSDVRTIYERAASKRATSIVSYNMISRGATHTVRPSLVDIGRFKKGGKLFGLAPRKYDSRMMTRALYAVTRYGVPDLLTLYFMGIDFQSHRFGPKSQADYLRTTVDSQVGRLWNHYRKDEPTIFVAVSDHGQIAVEPDDPHAIRFGLASRGPLGRLFASLGRRALDLPIDDENRCDTICTMNGFTAGVYLRDAARAWSDPPSFEKTVLPIARACLDAGGVEPGLKEAFASILLRDCERGGWNAPYVGLGKDGSLVDLGPYFESSPLAGLYFDAASRLRRAGSRLASDILILSAGERGYYFGGTSSGMHGCLHFGESECVLSFAATGMSREEATRFADVVKQAAQTCREADGRDYSSLKDLIPVLSNVTGW